jgi:hypothetical protein
LNFQLAAPKKLCINSWSLVNEKQAKVHTEEHHYKIIPADKFPDKKSFIELAKDYGKCQLDEKG